jgi:hypothetical protein
MEEACSPGTSALCQDAVSSAINQARAAEGVAPLVLPPSYGSLSEARQLLVLANSEREARGLPGFAALSPRLDTLAQQGAAADNDPDGPPGTAWGSNWAGGEGSALLADYDWTYNDGPGSPNLDCTKVTPGGCWDHRRNILADYGAHPVMGTAVTEVNGVTSMTELFSSALPGPFRPVPAGAKPPPAGKRATVFINRPLPSSRSLP